MSDARSGPLIDSVRTHLQDAVREVEAEVPYYRKAMPRYLATLEALRPFVHDGMTIAEIGPSPLAVAFARAGLATDVYGLFRSDNEVAALRDAGARTIEWNLLTREGPPDNGLYGLVLFLEVIEHLPLYPASVLQRVGRLVAPQGHLMVSTPDLHRLKNKAKFIVSRPLFGPFVETDSGQYHVREYALSEMTRYLDPAGLEPVATGRFGPFARSRVAATLRWLSPFTTLFTTHFYVVCRPVSGAVGTEAATGSERVRNPPA